MSSQNKSVKIILLPFISLNKIMKTSMKIKIGFCILAIIALISAAEPVINSYRLEGKSPDTVLLFPPYSYPSWQTPLGTDMYGRDIFGMILKGTRLTLSVGFLAGMTSILIAITLGLMSGYKGGFIDHVLRAATDFVMVVPTWPIMVLITAYVRGIDIIGLSLIIAAFSWAGPTRTLRSQVLSLKTRAYVDLAKVSGMNDIEIMYKEIMPNILPYIGVAFASGSLSAMFAETGIRLLGIGPPGIPTLGYLITLALNQGLLTTRPYSVIPAVICLISVFISINLINVGLDEIYNPRLKKITGF